MPRRLSQEELTQFGISTRHEQMDNGQLRFRLTGSDGSSYIRCENPGEPAWENSHCHAALEELILVQTGIVVFAELDGETAILRRMAAGEFVRTRPGIPHNEILSRGAVIHTIKFGDCALPDWIPSPLLDRLTKPLGFEEALQAADKSNGAFV